MQIPITINNSKLTLGYKITYIDIFLAKNHHTPKKFLYFVKQCRVVKSWPSFYKSSMRKSFAKIHIIFNKENLLFFVFFLNVIQTHLDFSPISEGHLSQLLDDPGAYLISPVLKQLVKSPYKKLDLQKKKVHNV